MSYIHPICLRHQSTWLMVMTMDNSAEQQNKSSVCSLPFIGLLLGRPSSCKTQTFSLLREWYCVYYTGDSTAKSFVSHSTSVSKEELAEIDMLPRIKNRLFLTPKLAPMFRVRKPKLRQWVDHGDW